MLGCAHRERGQDVIKLNLVTTTVQNKIRPVWKDLDVVKLQLEMIHIVRMLNGATPKFERLLSRITLIYGALGKMCQLCNQKWRPTNDPRMTCVSIELPKTYQKRAYLS